MRTCKNEIQKFIWRRENKKREYGQNRYHNISDEKKQ